MNARMSMLSYHNDADLKRRFVNQIEAHRRSDRIVQGTYGELNDKWKGCAVGCSVRSLEVMEKGRFRKEVMINGRDHARVSKALGIPLQLVYLEDRVFEGLPRAAAVGWPGRFSKAVPVGADLSLIWPAFALWLLRGLRQEPCVVGVIRLYERPWGTVSREEWRSAAANAAYAAAYAAANAAYAAYAAYAAAYAAYARVKFWTSAADKLIELLEGTK